MTPADYSKWSTLDWSVKSASPLRRYDDSRRFRGMAGARRRRPVPATYAGIMASTRFMSSSVSRVDPWLAFAERQSRLRVSCTTSECTSSALLKWLAQRYGYHPAVLGFAIGNETNLQSARGTDRYLDYWQYLNHLSAIAKRYAPDKITMTAFADYPSGKTPMLLKPFVELSKKLLTRIRARRRFRSASIKAARTGGRTLHATSTASFFRRHLRARRLGIQRVSQARD